MIDCGALRHRAVLERRGSARRSVLMYFWYSASTSLMKTGWRCSMHQTGNWLRIGRVARVRRVALALLDGQPVLDLVALGMIEPDAEHVGVGELVHALVELAEDGVEVERRGDLAADLAQQLDVLLALALGARQRLGGFGAQLRFGELRALAFLADHAPALHAVEPTRASSPASSR